MERDPRFALQAHLDDLYAFQPRRLAFRAETPEAFQAWQAALRQAVRQVLGIAGRTLPQSARVEHLQQVDRGAYTEHKYALDVGETEAPIYLLVPHGEPPFKPMLVLHGHNPSVNYVLGNYPNEQVAAEMRAVDNNYAQALAQAGHLVCAVEQRGFGERISDQFTEPDWPNTCRHLSFEYLMQGRTMLGERVWDAQLALTYLLSRDDVAPGGVGCTGNSGGGTTTLWLSALDERITVSVPSCYFCSFKHSILGVRHCECNYVPGILELCEMGDLAALVAPRPFRAIAGEQDPIFPIAGVRQQWQTVERAYELVGASDRCSLAVHPGEHAYHHALSHEWFGRWL